MESPARALAVPVILLGAVITSAAVHAGDACQPQWLPTFGGPPGTGAGISVLAVFDDRSGGGPALYAGGSFTSAGGVTANHIAKWDGFSWSALGSGVDDEVEALAVFDDGSGGGPALYAGGAFTTAGGVGADRIAKWDGTSWLALGTGMNTTVLAVDDDSSGAGPALYAGGDFTMSPAGDWYLARWQGCSTCPWDLDGNSNVGIVDFLMLLALWHTNPGGPPDFDGDDIVAITDFLALLGAWGPCP